MSVHDSSGRRSHADTDAYESASRETILVIESCRVTWLFDLASRRFRRVPTGAALDVPVPASAWTDYHALTFDKERRTFSISLNAETTRVHRSSYHLGPCALCGWNRHGQGVTS